MSLSVGHPSAYRSQVREILREGTERLQAAGVTNAQQEAEWLLGRLVTCSPLDLYLEEPTLSPNTIERFVAHVDARASGVPLQYVLGEAEFFGERFVVEPGVFIPRPETETIVEAVLQHVRASGQLSSRPLQLLDLGTGSGCIAVTLARGLPACVVVGVELSWRVLCVAQRNILRHGLCARVQCVQGRWLEPIRGQCDGVISNPPYVPSARVDHLPLDVRQEPRLSLDGGADGMRELVTLITQAPQILRRGGFVALECGEEHVEPLVHLASMASWVKQVRPLHDLVHRPRGVLIQAY